MPSSGCSAEAGLGGAGLGESDRGTLGRRHRRELRRQTSGGASSRLQHGDGRSLHTWLLSQSQMALFQRKRNSGKSS